jgi:1-acyl-sn-glycerol-3-phosphate acyltransferase
MTEVLDGATATRGAGAERAPEAALPTFDRKTWLYTVFQHALRFASIMVVDLKTYGVENVPKRGGVLIVANHQSYLDPAVLGVNIRRPASFLAKSELFENRYFGGLIRRLNAFPVRQGEGDVGAVRETIKRLQEGHLLIVFPEGTRSPDGRIAPMEKGVGLIVRRAGPTVKVVPAAVWGGTRAWPPTQRLPRSHPVRVKYGQPLMLSEVKAAEVVQVVDREIRRLYAELELAHGPE